jgi:hypothetical protein
MKANDAPELYGVMAEFATPEGLLAAIRASRQAGYQELEAYTPYPIEAVWEEIGHHRSKVPLLVLVGGILGGLGGFALQYWTSVIEYPLNIGGRPFNSWPAFVVPTFECTILAAAATAVLGMFFLNGLPSPYHPVFNVPRFAAASRDRYFLVIKTTDEKFDRDDARRLLATVPASEVSDVEY